MHAMPIIIQEQRISLVLEVGSVFLYRHSKKGWKVYNLATGDSFVSRDVIFNETCFPFVDNNEENPEPNSLASQHPF